MLSNKNIVLLIEGFGISSSWRGNAIYTASPKNFFDMWQSCPHFVLGAHESKDHSPYCDLTSFSTISTGNKVLSNQDFISSIIENGEFFETKSIIGVFDYVLKQNSTLHLAGTLSAKKSGSSSLFHLKSLLLMAKQRKFFNVSVHLFLEGENLSDRKKLLQTLNDLNDYVNSLGVGEISTIAGKNFIADNISGKDFLVGYENLLNGRGRNAMSFEQAVSLLEKDDRPPVFAKPTSIIYRGKKASFVKDFDGILFFNFDSREFTNIILALIQKTSQFRGISLPRFLRVSTFFNPFPQKIDNLHTLLKRTFSGTLSALLAAEGVKQAFISDNTRISEIKEYFQGLERPGSLISNYYVSTVSKSGSYLGEYDLVIKKMLDLISQNVDKKSDFIMVDIPVIENMANLSTFDNTVHAVKLVDRSLPSFVALAKKYNYNLILLSNHGRAERMLEKSLDFGYTDASPLPFLLYEPGMEIVAEKAVSMGNKFMYDILIRKYNLMDIAPTILGLYHIKKAGSMKGKNILKEIEEHED